MLRDFTMIVTKGKEALPVLLLAAGFLFAVSPSAVADINLAKIFSDHMVLQHSSTIEVRGTSDPLDRMVIQFDGQTYNTEANDSGDWLVEIQTHEPGGPFELDVSVDGAEPRVVISDVMAGEVWLCSGQWNMEWPVSESLNPDTEIEQARNVNNVRLFKIEHSTSTEPMNEFEKVQLWDCCSPEVVGSFSATAYFFGRELSRALDMPIGLIQASHGDSRCEAWASRMAMDDLSELAPLLRHWDENATGLNDVDRPGNLFNAMIAPLKGFAIRGAIWYEGEANVGRGEQYQSLFPTLIKNWRDELAGGEEFPFYFVQLAPFRYNGMAPEALAELREAQRMTVKSVANTGMVVTTDIGNVNEFRPPNKQEVGRRLALWALSGTYDGRLPDEDKVAVFSGPVFESMSTRIGKVRLVFASTGDGLIARDSDSLSHFTVCGADGIFVPASAVIDGDAVIVSSPDVSEPEEVRFAWDDSAEPNFFNSAGLPASPFRTDEFELLSREVDF